MSLRIIEVNKEEYKNPPKGRVDICQVNTWRDDYSMWGDGAILSVPCEELFSLGMAELKGEIFFEIKGKETEVLTSIPLRAELEICNEGNNNSNGVARIEMWAEIIGPKNKIFHSGRLYEFRTTDGKKKITVNKGVRKTLPEGAYYLTLRIELSAEARKGWNGFVSGVLNRVDLKVYDLSRERMDDMEEMLGEIE